MLNDFNSASNEGHLNRAHSEWQQTKTSLIHVRQRTADDVPNWKSVANWFVPRHAQPSAFGIQRGYFARTNSKKRW